MNPKTFFKETIEDLRNRATSDDDYSLIQSSALLRKLLLDKDPLLNQFKREIDYKIPVNFTVIDYIPPAITNEADFYSIPLSPELSRPLPTKEIKIEEFLTTGVFIIKGRVYTVRELIKYLAHAEGGVHIDIEGVKKDLDLTNEDITKITELQNQLKINGLSSISREIKKIAMVVLKTIDPILQKSLQ